MHTGQGIPVLLHCIAWFHYSLGLNAVQAAHTANTVCQLSNKPELLVFHRKRKFLKCINANPKWTGNLGSDKWGTIQFFWSTPFFLLDFVYLFLERGRWRKKRGRKSLSVASQTPPPSGLAHNPGTCPDQGSKRRPFVLRDNARPTELHQSGLIYSMSEIHFYHYK